MQAWIASNWRFVTIALASVLVAALIALLIVRPWAGGDQEAVSAPTPTATTPAAEVTPPPEIATGVVTGEGLELSLPDGASLRIPADALPTGTRVELAATHSDALDVLGELQPTGIAWSIEASTEPTSPVEFVVPYEPSPGARPLVATYDELTGLWLPVETAADEDARLLTAALPSFSLKTWFYDRVDDVAGGASWLEYQLGRVTGNRAEEPDCSANPQPSWIRQVITNPDHNAQLFACVGGEGDGFALHVANNRGYPVAVEFDRPFTAAAPSRFDSGLSGLAAQLISASGQNRVPLLPTGTAVISYNPVDEPSGHLQGWARRDVGALLTYLVLELAREVGADIPVGNGQTLGIAAIECYVHTVSAGVDLGAADIISAGNQLTGCLADTLTHEVREWGFDPEANFGSRLWSDQANALPTSAQRMVAGLRFLRALDVAQWTHTAADLFINDANPEADLVDIGVRWDAAPRWGAGGVGGVYLHQLDAEQDGPGGSSGELTGGVLDGRAVPNSTSAWVSCTTTPSTLTYQLDGGYHSLAATVGVAPHTPASVVASVSVVGDGRPLGEVSVGQDRTAPLEVDLTGVDEMTIEVIRVAGECEASSIPYGVLGDAHLIPTETDGIREVPEGFVGRWSGQMTQPSSSRSPYSMTVELEAGPVNSVVADVVYDDLDCGGEWTLVRAEPDRIVVEETITYGTHTCVDGFLEVRPTGDGRLDVAWYITNGLDGDPEAWATLS